VTPVTPGPEATGVKEIRGQDRAPRDVVATHHIRNVGPPGLVISCDSVAGGNRRSGDQEIRSRGRREARRCWPAGDLGARRRAAQPESGRSDSARRVRSPRSASLRITTGASVRLAGVALTRPYSPRVRAERVHERRPLSRRAEAGPGRAVPARLERWPSLGAHAAPSASKAAARFPVSNPDKQVMRLYPAVHPTSRPT
jgi:hypothetical protein